MLHLGVEHYRTSVWNLVSNSNVAEYFRISLEWRHNGRDSVSNYQPHDCLLNRLFRRRSTKTSKLRVIGLCAGNSPVTGEFPAQMASNAEDASIQWRHIYKVFTLIKVPVYKHYDRINDSWLTPDSIMNMSVGGGGVNTTWFKSYLLQSIWITICTQ